MSSTGDPQQPTSQLDVWCRIDHAGRIRRCNGAFAARFGLAADGEALLGRPFSEVVAIDGVEAALATDALQVAFDEGRPETVVIGVRCVEGTRWVSWQFLPDECDVSAYGRDVSDLRSQLDLARTNSERLELAVESANCGLWDWNIATGQVWRSPSLLRILGFEGRADALPPIQEAWEVRVHPDDYDRVQRAMVAHFDAFEAYDIQYRVRVADGSFRWVHSRGEMHRDIAGEPVRMTGSLLDIEAQKNVEADLQRARREAEAASAAKSAFLANMSHEIRTPMNAILGFTDLLRDADLDPTTRAQHLETIRRNGDHLLSLIDDVLDLSKIEADRVGVESVPVDVPRLIGDLVATLRTRAQAKQLELDAVFATSVPETILSDPLRLRQILVNLLGNALKFTEAGRVRVLLAYDRRPGEQPWLRLRVEDTGVGLSDGQIERLFQPFSQADVSTTRRFGGTGLGLTISARLAQLLQGRISVTSRKGIGSAFDLEIPVRTPPDVALVTELPRVDPSPETEPTVLPDRRGHVLLAEDGEDNQTLISLILRKAGVDVTVVSNGREAVDRLRAGESFDLILMDMQMPVLDGYAATAEIRALGNAIPIVALTAHAMSSDRDHCLAAGCTDYESKPVKRDRLIALVARYIGSESPA